MAITVNNTSVSQSLINQTNKNQLSIGNSFRKLSSGLEVSRAMDNAAALSIISKMNSEVRGLNQAT